MKFRFLAVCAVLASFTIAPPTLAQQSTCVTIDNDGQRLACYDAANGRTPRAPQAVASPALHENHNPIPNIFASADTSRPPVQYEVAGLSRGGDGVVYISMTNREIWAVPGRAAALPQPGTHVSIQRQRVGLYVLSYEGAQPLEVRKQN